MSHPITYTITAIDPHAHLFRVSVKILQPNKTGQLLALPAWIPGSYMIRDFSRHIVQIYAQSGKTKIALHKQDKDTWCAAPCRGALTVHYDVYAWDLSVRAAHLDQTHGFFNGSSVFLRVIGQESSQHIVDIVRPKGSGYKDWRLATSLPTLGAKQYDFGTYVADDYDALIDHPVEMGTFTLASFKAHGVAHDVAITGVVPNLDMPRLCRDLKKICQAHIALFEPVTKRAPVSRYVFLMMVVGDGYGGLEHRSSTALLCARAGFPTTADTIGMTDAYRNLLGLCSHEYFHTWNVKRIKPAAFAPYNLQTENYTSLLWLFEGFTSYYDDLILLKSGVIDRAAYFSLLAKTINNVLDGSGRHKQSVSESSFDAWTKYYRQDENSPNAIVSYYTKGALIALALDLTIRQKTRNKKSLDDVMRMLWEHYGKDFYARGKKPANAKGITPEQVQMLLREVSGVSFKKFIDDYVDGVDDLPLEKLLAHVGVALTDQRKSNKPNMGMRSSASGEYAKVQHVYEGGAAHRGGVAAGDVLVALDNVRVTATNIDKLLSRYCVGDVVSLHVYRGDVLMLLSITLMSDVRPQYILQQRSKPSAAMLSSFRSWLN